MKQNEQKKCCSTYKTEPSINNKKSRNMGRKKKNADTPEIHNDLKGFNIKINEFGEIKASFSIDKLNTFLNKKVDDKKFKDDEK